MGDYWVGNLQRAKFADVEFPVTRRELSGGRAWAKHRFAFRDGQDDEDTGREPYVFDVEIALFRSIDENHYPTLFEQLRFAFDDPDTKGRAEYQDPELGPITVKVDKWRWTADAMERDGGRFHVRLEEVSAEAFHLTTAAGEEIGQSPEAIAELADGELASLGVTKADGLDALDAAGVAVPDESEIEEGALVAGVVGLALDVIQNGAIDATEITAALEMGMQRLAALAELDAVGDVDGAEALGLLVEIGNALASTADRELRASTPISSIVLEQGLSAAEIALRLYGDASRADEVERRNPTFCSLLYAAGSTLSVLAT